MSTYVHTVCTVQRLLNESVFSNLFQETLADLIELMKTVEISFQCLHHQLGGDVLHLLPSQVVNEVNEVSQSKELAKSENRIYASVVAYNRR